MEESNPTKKAVDELNESKAFDKTPDDTKAMNEEISAMVPAKETCKNDVHEYCEKPMEEKKTL